MQKQGEIWSDSVRNAFVMVMCCFVLPMTLALSLDACASTPVQRAQHVSVDVHAALAGIQDAEATIYQSGAVPTWTPDKHKQFNGYLVIALTAGKALNEGVRAVPVAPDAKANLATVGEALTKLDAIATEALPPGNKVATAIHAATTAVLQILPIFLS